MSDLQKAALQYIDWEPTPSNRSAMQALVDANDQEGLEQHLLSRIQFGTAGLRAQMGAGYHRMNSLVILQTCQGLIRYLDSCDTNAKQKGIVVGYDHRCLGEISSLKLAEITAAVFLTAGYKVYLLENFVATPFVPFAIGQYKCAVGIMVTASHNPKADNGYKVYWGNGAQIIPPHDINIANFISSNLAPWQVYDVDTIRFHPQLQIVTEEVAKAYIESITRLASSHDTNAQSPIRIAYTAMHGVGRKWVERAFKAFNHPSLHVVPSQSEPDPEFPTVVFPNPEEKGALDEAMRFATSEGCTLILANDPDADRLAAAERLPDNTWRVFSGNEIGALLGYWQIKQWKEKNSASGGAAVLASVVSSRMLKKIAEAEGVQYHDTLTGFKWLGNRAQDLRATGVNVLFSYEEALGFCCGDVLCDKDGISAACIFAEMAGALHTKNMTVNDQLKELALRYGEFVSYNSYIICLDSALTDRIFLRLRTGGENNGGYWTSVNCVRIITLKDITMGYDGAAEGNVCSMPTTPDSHMIMYEFENGVTITLRTSGTEPKIKFYTEIAGQPGQKREELRSQLVSFVDAAVEEMLEPTKHGLVRA